MDHLNFKKIYGHRFPINERFFYTCKNVLKRAEYIDESLARFYYQFPNDDTFYLNLFPINEEYLKDLLLKTGFANVKILGNFNEIYDSDSDNYIHIAEKV